MEITKIFRVENSHSVRNCTSDRCKHSYHGHSYVIELTLEGIKLDNAGMLMDFGLMKGTIKEFIDSFDHCHTIYAQDYDECRDFFKRFNERWIELPVNPSAEYLCVVLFRFCQLIIDHTNFKNGEGTIAVKSVKVHETVTGSATCFESDVKELWDDDWMKYVKFSKGVTDDWSADLKNIIFKRGSVDNPIVNQQVRMDHGHI